jgi:hypothetical protein
MWKMLQINVEKIKTHISYSVNFFRNSAVYEVMWKNVVDFDRPQMIIWLMRIAFWIPEATNTQSEYLIRIAFPLQRWLHEYQYQYYVVRAYPVLFSSFRKLSCNLRGFCSRRIFPYHCIRMAPSQFPCIYIHIYIYVNCIYILQLIVTLLKTTVVQMCHQHCC